MGERSRLYAFFYYLSFRQRIRPLEQLRILSVTRKSAFQLYQLTFASPPSPLPSSFRQRNSHTHTNAHRVCEKVEKKPRFLFICVVEKKMVARTPPKKQRKMVAPPLSPTLLRETVKKVDKCMARLQELQYTVTGGANAISAANLRTSLRYRHDTLRVRNGNNSRRSPTGKLPVTPEEWRRMSLPAMLLGETMVEIMQASQFARTIVDAVSYKAGKPATDDPKTPLTERRKQKPDNTQNSSLQARRRREKQSLRSESSSDMPSLRRAKSKINFKISPLKNNCDKENCRYIANRVSPRNKPWVKKTVLFPNPLFHSSPTSHNQKFCKTKSPVIARNRQTPHKFLIKSPNASKFQVKIKSPPVCVSPTRAAGLGKKSPPKANLSGAAKLRRSFSPSRLANRLVSPARVAGLGKKSPPKANLSAAAKLRRSFSPSRLANRLVSPLKSRKSSVQRNEEDMKKMMSGLKQRPASFSIQFSPRRI